MNPSAATEPDRGMLEPLRSDLPMAAQASGLLFEGLRMDDEPGFLAAALPQMAAAARLEYLALAVSQSGRWVVEAETGSSRPAPARLLAEALDREALQVRGNWLALPVAAPGPCRGPGRLRKTAPPPPSGNVLEVLAPIFYEALSAVRRRAEAGRRVAHLEEILHLVRHWSRTREVEPLLAQMAQAATQLLQADRASIFLWDRPNHTLVGRPALGVPEGELRIADNRGVVGRVIQTGQPCRVDAALEPHEIDHHVDAQLQYRTQTLLCVPLQGSSGELLGAFEVLNKRQGTFTDADEAALVELAALAAIVLKNAQDCQQLLAANRQIAAEAAQGVRLVGQSPAIAALRSIIQRVADTDLAVLILGENGTGKEVVAQSIHYGSQRCAKPFIVVNCAAIPEHLAESELFGHEKGAFTDAHEARPGKFELASGGTLFLDEIGDLSLACQAKLLRVLEEKVLLRVGGSRPIHTDARLVAATNQPLAEMVRQKRFREDLYFRLNVVTLELPPLRERPGDILLLAQHFLAEFSARRGAALPSFRRAPRSAWRSTPGRATSASCAT